VRESARRAFGRRSRNFGTRRVQLVPRSRHLRSAAPRVGMLVAACVMLWRADAMAQTAAPLFQSPLAPLPESGNAKNPPTRFQKVPPQQPSQLGQPQRFVPASGAGKTGFNSTNVRRPPSKTAPNSAAQPNVA